MCGLKYNRIGGAAAVEYSVEYSVNMAMHSWLGIMPIMPASWSSLTDNELIKKREENSSVEVNCPHHEAPLTRYVLARHTSAYNNKKQRT